MNIRFLIAVCMMFSIAQASQDTAAQAAARDQAAKAISTLVTVEVPCYQRSSAGECILWGGIIQGCKGPCSIPLFVTPYTKDSVQGCSAHAGSSCNAVGLTNPPGAVQVGTIARKVPCITDDGAGTCLRWGGLIQGCVAPAGGTCQTNIAHGERVAACSAQPGATCNSVIRIQYP